MTGAAGAAHSPEAEAVAQRPRGRVPAVGVCHHPEGAAALQHPEGAAVRLHQEPAVAVAAAGG